MAFIVLYNTLKIHQRMSKIRNVILQHLKVLKGISFCMTEGSKHKGKFSTVIRPFSARQLAFILGLSV